MSITLPGNLNNKLWNTILEDLSEDPKNILYFGLVSKICYQITKPFLHYMKTAHFLTKHYTFTKSPHNSIKLWKLLTLFPVVLLGENHTVDAHRQKNSVIVHALWHPGIRQLLTESKMPPGVGPVKYLHPKLVEESKSWDITLDWFEEHIEKIRKNASLFQQFIDLFQNIEAKDFIKKGEMFLKTLKLDHPETDLSSLEKLIKKIDALPLFDFSSKEKGKIIVTAEEMLQITLPLNLKQEFLSQSLSMIGTFVVNLEKFFRNEVKKASLKRTQHFFQSIVTELQLKKRPIAIAGLKHLKDARLINALNSIQIPYLCAIPRNEDTFSSQNDDTSSDEISTSSNDDSPQTLLLTNVQEINGVNFHYFVKSQLLFYYQASSLLYAQLDQSQAILDQLQKGSKSQ